MMANSKYQSIIGDTVPYPDPLPEEIQQMQRDTCAVKSQQIIMHAFGVDIPENQLAQLAQEKGYWAPGFGSDPALMGQLLIDVGIPTHAQTGATVYDLIDELAQGHKVIVGVDADELWYPSFFNDYFGEKPNHALIVTGIDTTDPNNVEVILTDPGTGEVARRYPIDQFLDAWHDSNCHMIATDIPAPLEHSPEMVNFDYVLGHLPTVLGMPFEFFHDTIVPAADAAFDWVVDAVTDNFLVNGITETFTGISELFSDVTQYISQQVDAFTGNFHPDTHPDFNQVMTQATNHVGCVIHDFDHHQPGEFDTNDFHNTLFG